MSATLLSCGLEADACSCSGSRSAEWCWMLSSLTHPRAVPTLHEGCAPASTSTQLPLRDRRLPSTHTPHHDRTTVICQTEPQALAQSGAIASCACALHDQLQVASVASLLDRRLPQSVHASRTPPPSRPNALSRCPLTPPPPSTLQVAAAQRNDGSTSTARACADASPRR